MVIDAGDAARPSVITTSRLRLVAVPARFLEASLCSNRRSAQAYLGLHVPREWLAETDLIETWLAEFRADPTYCDWGLRAVGIAASRVMIGHVGFHSPPNPDYLQPYWPHGIELGYTIYPRYRRCGYGFEATRGLLRWAAGSADLRRFLLSISGENTASRRLAEKLGFVRASAHRDDEHNLEYLYVLQGEAMARLLTADETASS
jgi:RimJ/RimL family protein N-acetyltransferase